MVVTITNDFQNLSHRCGFSLRTMFILSRRTHFDSRGGHSIAEHIWYTYVKFTPPIHFQYTLIAIDNLNLHF